MSAGRCSGRAVGGRAFVALVLGLLVLDASAAPNKKPTRAGKSSASAVEEPETEEPARSAAPVRAARRVDAEPPLIACTVPTEVLGGKVRISFSIRDESALFGVIFRWRPEGEVAFRELEMPSSGPSFVAELDDVDGPFEFWIEAYDEFGNGPATFASREAPAKVAVRPPEADVVVAAPRTERVGRGEQLPFGRREPEPVPEDVPVLVTRPETFEPYRALRLGRVMTARRLQRRGFEVRIDGAISLGSDVIYPGASLLGQSGALSVAFQPHEAVTVFAEGSSGRSALTYPSGVAGLIGWTGTDLGLGARWSSPLVGRSRMALATALELPAVAAGSARALSARFDFVWTLDLSVVRLHTNAGYHLDNSARTYAGRWTAFNTLALGLSRYDALRLGFAVEAVLMRRLYPYLEWRLEVPVDWRQFASCDGASETKTCAPNPPLFPAAARQMPQFLGLGTRIDASSHVAIDVGADFAFTQGGSGFSGTSPRESVPLDGLATPAPMTFRVGLSFQFGVPPAEEERPPRLGAGAGGRP
jgi:hypothetical protein